MIYRWKHPDWKSHIAGLMQGFAEVADGLVTLGSLGFYASSFEMSIARYRARRAMELQIQKRNRCRE